MGSITMKRLLGLEKRKPKGIYVELEEEFYKAIKKNQLKMTTVVNHGVEDYLRSQGVIINEE